MNISSPVAVLLLFCSFAGAQNRIDSASIRTEILSVMDRQVRGWNSGSVESFMEGYERSDSLRFASGGSVTYGWKTMLERYRKNYSTRESMGILTFTGISVEIISSDAAAVFGTWRLQREKDAPAGLFTLIVRRTAEGWKIVHDHTSSAPEK